MNAMKTGGNACVCYLRSISVGTGRNMHATTAARPWCRETSSVIGRRKWNHSQLAAPGNGRRGFRSIGSVRTLVSNSNSSRTSSSCSEGIGKGNGNGNDPAATRRIAAAVFAAIASGACFDRLGTIDDNCDTDDDRIFGGIIKGPMVARMTKRRDTSIQIRFGDSILMDHAEPRSSTTIAGANDETIVLLLPEDKETISPFLYYLMTQVKLVRVQKDGNHLQHNLPIGLPGLGCVHCTSSTATKTRSEIFPLDRRTFPSMVRKNLYNHIRRCERCPVEVKLELRRLKKLEIGTKISREERLFFKKLWFRMGHKAVL